MKVGRPRTFKTPKQCGNCGRLFARHNLGIKRWATTRYCSHRCAMEAKTADINERFDSHVGPPDHNGCWPWTGYRNKEGYGRFCISRKSGTTPAHRFAYARKFGKPPKGKLVRHTCDNPPCVNPDHLIIGTHKDNAQDMLDRGRSARGSRHKFTRVTDDDVRKIRQSLLPPRTLAIQYGITPSTAGNIKARRQRKHVKDYDDFKVPEA